MGSVDPGDRFLRLTVSLSRPCEERFPPEGALDRNYWGFLIFWAVLQVPKMDFCEPVGE